MPVCLASSALFLFNCRCFAKPWSVSAPALICDPVACCCCMKGVTFCGGSSTPCSSSKPVGSPLFGGGCVCALQARNLWNSCVIWRDSCLSCGFAVCAASIRAALCRLLMADDVVASDRLERCRLDPLCGWSACLCHRGVPVCSRLYNMCDMLWVVNWRIFGVYVCITAGSMIACRCCQRFSEIKESVCVPALSYITNHTAWPDTLHLPACFWAGKVTCYSCGGESACPAEASYENPRFGLAPLASTVPCVSVSVCDCISMPHITFDGCHPYLRVCWCPCRPGAECCVLPFMTKVSLQPLCICPAVWASYISHLVAARLSNNCKLWPLWPPRVCVRLRCPHTQGL